MPGSPSDGQAPADDDFADEHVWFMGPTNGPGYHFLVSYPSGKIIGPVPRSGRRPDEGHRPPGFPSHWHSMDRSWSACRQPQGTAAMDYAEGWSVLSVADYTQDRRPNVMVSFAVQRADVPQEAMLALARRRYPRIVARLGVGDDA